MLLQVKMSSKGENSTGEGSRSDSPEIDYSVIRTAIQIGGRVIEQVMNGIHYGSEEVRNLLLEECEVILECKVCRNLFRSLPNLVAHKRAYCTDLFEEKKRKENQLPDIEQVDTVVVEPASPSETSQQEETSNSDKNGPQQSVVDKVVQRTFQGQSKSYEFYTKLAEKVEAKKVAKVTNTVTLKSIPTNPNAVILKVGEENLPSTKEKLSDEKRGHTDQDTAGNVVPPSKPKPSIGQLCEKLANRPVTLQGSPQSGTNVNKPASVRAVRSRKSSPRKSVDNFIGMKETIEKSSDKTPSHASIQTDIDIDGSVDEIEEEEVINTDMKLIGSDYSLDKLWLIHCDMKTLQCKTCNKSFSTPYGLKFHCKMKHVDKMVQYPCPTCKKSFTYFTALARHLRKVHSKSESYIDFIQTKLKGNVGRRKSTDQAEIDSNENSPENLKKNMLAIDTGWRKCDKCGKICWKAKSYYRHYQHCKGPADGTKSDSAEASPVKNKDKDVKYKVTVRKPIFKSSATEDTESVKENPKFNEKLTIRTRRQVENSLHPPSNNIEKPQTDSGVSGTVQSKQNNECLTIKETGLKSVPGLSIKETGLKSAPGLSVKETGLKSAPGLSIKETGLKSAPGLSMKETGLKSAPGLSVKETGLKSAPGLSIKETGLKSAPGLSIKETGLKSAPGLSIKETGLKSAPGLSIKETGLKSAPGLSIKETGLKSAPGLSIKETGLKSVVKETGFKPVPGLQLEKNQNHISNHASEQRKQGINITDNVSNTTQAKEQNYKTPNAGETAKDPMKRHTLRTRNRLSDQSLEISISESDISNKSFQEKSLTVSPSIGITIDPKASAKNPSDILMMARKIVNTGKRLSEQSREDSCETESSSMSSPDRPLNTKVSVDIIEPREKIKKTNLKDKHKQQEEIHVTATKKTYNKHSIQEEKQSAVGAAAKKTDGKHNIQEEKRDAAAKTTDNHKLQKQSMTTSRSTNTKLEYNKPVTRRADGTLPSKEGIIIDLTENDTPVAQSDQDKSVNTGHISEAKIAKQNMRNETEDINTHTYRRPVTRNVDTQVSEKKLSSAKNISVSEPKNISENLEVAPVSVERSKSPERKSNRKIVAESPERKSSSRQAVAESPERKSSRRPAVAESHEQKSSSRQAVAESHEQKTSSRKAVAECPERKLSRPTVAESPERTSSRRPAVAESPERKSSRAAVAESPERTSSRRPAVAESHEQKSSSRQAVSESAERKSSSRLAPSESPRKAIALNQLKSIVVRSLGETQEKGKGIERNADKETNSLSPRSRARNIALNQLKRLTEANASVEKKKRPERISVDRQVSVESSSSRETLDSPVWSDNPMLKFKMTVKEMAELVESASLSKFARERKKKAKQLLNNKQNSVNKASLKNKPKSLTNKTLKEKSVSPVKIVYGTRLSTSSKSEVTGQQIETEERGHRYATRHTELKTSDNSTTGDKKLAGPENSKEIELSASQNRNEIAKMSTASELSESLVSSPNLEQATLNSKRKEYLAAKRDQRRKFLIANKTASPTKNSPEKMIQTRSRLAKESPALGDSETNKDRPPKLDLESPLLRNKNVTESTENQEVNTSHTKNDREIDMHRRSSRHSGQIKANHDDSLVKNTENKPKDAKISNASTQSQTSRRLSDRTNDRGNKPERSEKVGVFHNETGINAKLKVETNYERLSRKPANTDTPNQKDTSPDLRSKSMSIERAKSMVVNKTEKRDTDIPTRRSRSSDNVQSTKVLSSNQHEKPLLVFSDPEVRLTRMKSKDTAISKPVVIQEFNNPVAKNDNKSNTMDDLKTGSDHSEVQSEKVQDKHVNVSTKDAENSETHIHKTRLSTGSIALVNIAKSMATDESAKESSSDASPVKLKSKRMTKRKRHLSEPQQDLKTKPEPKRFSLSTGVIQCARCGRTFWKKTSYRIHIMKSPCAKRVERPEKNVQSMKEPGETSLNMISVDKNTDVNLKESNESGNMSSTISNAGLEKRARLKRRLSTSPNSRDGHCLSTETSDNHHNTKRPRLDEDDVAGSVKGNRERHFSDTLMGGMSDEKNSETISENSKSDNETKMDLIASGENDKKSETISENTNSANEKIDQLDSLKNVKNSETISKSTKSDNETLVDQLDSAKNVENSETISENTKSANETNFDQLGSGENVNNSETISENNKFTNETRIELLDSGQSIGSKDDIRNINEQLPGTSQDFQDEDSDTGSEFSGFSEADLTVPNLTDFTSDNSDSDESMKSDENNDDSSCQGDDGIEQVALECDKNKVISVEEIWVEKEPGMPVVEKTKSNRIYVMDTDRSSKLHCQDTRNIDSFVDEANLKCLKCDREFTSVSNMRQHVIRHLGWKRYQCKLCSVCSYYNLSEIRMHLSRSHNIHAESEESLKTFIKDLNKEAGKKRSDKRLKTIKKKRGLESPLNKGSKSYRTKTQLKRQAGETSESDNLTLTELVTKIKSSQKGTSFQDRNAVPIVKSHQVNTKTEIEHDVKPQINVLSNTAEKLKQESNEGKEQSPIDRSDETQLNSSSGQVKKSVRLAAKEDTRKSAVEILRGPKLPPSPKKTVEYNYRKPTERRVVVSPKTVVAPNKTDATSKVVVSPKIVVAPGKTDATRKVIVSPKIVVAPGKTVERKSESPKKTETPTKATKVDEKEESTPLTKARQMLAMVLK